MLGKLIKHEWRSFWKIPAFVSVFLMLFTLFGIISLHTRVWDTNNKIIQTLLVLAVVFYYIALIVISFTVAIYIAVRFYKNMYTDEGYLTHTLPVCKKELIFSKLLVSFLWAVITGIVIIISILSLAATLVSVFGADMSLADLFREVARVIYSSDFKEVFGISAVHATILLLLSVIFGSISSILMLYTAISLGQLFQRHKVFGSILSYIGIYMVLQIVNTIITSPMLFKMSMSSALTMPAGPYLYFILGESIVLSIIMFFLTEWLMTKKLNLD